MKIYSKRSLECLKKPQKIAAKDGPMLKFGKKLKQIQRTNEDVKRHKV